MSEGNRAGHSPAAGATFAGRAVWLVVFSMLLAPSAAWAQGASPPKSDQSNCDRAQFRVIVDVGHTAEVPGAKSARGLTEYEFNLRLAQLIERHLLDAGFGKTLLLITPGPARRSLVERVERANKSPAHLFLSI